MVVEKLSHRYNFQFHYAVKVDLYSLREGKKAGGNVRGQFNFTRECFLSQVWEANSCCYTLFVGYLKSERLKKIS